MRLTRNQAMNATILLGTAHGRTIELERESGLPDGQPVQVTLVPSGSNGTATGAEALTRLQRAAGGWTDDTAGLERFLEWNRQRRKSQRREFPE